MFIYTTHDVSPIKIKNKKIKHNAFELFVSYVEILLYVVWKKDKQEEESS